MLPKLLTVDIPMVTETVPAVVPLNPNPKLQIAAAVVEVMPSSQTSSQIEDPGAFEWRMPLESRLNCQKLVVVVVVEVVDVVVDVVVVVVVEVVVGPKYNS